MTRHGTERGNNMLKYLLLGRKGSGREFFQKLLETNGLTVAKSYTTREKRDSNDVMHRFVTKEQAANVENKILTTEHDGFVYFYTKDEIEKADIIPIDPENVKTICQLYPDAVFRIIEIMASNDDRIAHSTTDADDKLLTEEEFLAACEAENEAFSAFEDIMTTQKLNVDNIFIAHIANNDFTANADIYKWPEKIITAKRVFSKTLIILEELKNHAVFVYDADKNKYRIWLSEDDFRDISPDQMAETILVDPEGMKCVMTSWLSLEREI